MRVFVSVLAMRFSFSLLAIVRSAGFAPQGRQQLCTDLGLLK